MDRQKFFNQVSEGLDTLGSVQFIDEPKETALDEIRRWYNSHKRIQMFEKYIHINECSDMNGWFGYFCPNGNATIDYDLANDKDLIVHSCESEEEVMRKLAEMVSEL